MYGKSLATILKLPMWCTIQLQNQTFFVTQNENPGQRGDMTQDKVGCLIF